MPRKRHRTPQEKKALSLKKDRRNAYGESTAGSRRGIRTRKRWARKSNRRRARQALSQGDDPGKIKPRYWRKYPDIPLSEWIQIQRRKRRAHRNRRKPKG